MAEAVLIIAEGGREAGIDHLGCSEAAFRGAATVASALQQPAEVKAVSHRAAAIAGDIGERCTSA